MTKEEWIDTANLHKDKLKAKFQEALELIQNSEKTKITIVLGSYGNCYITEFYTQDENHIDFITFNKKFDKKKEIERFAKEVDFWFNLFFETFIERLELTF
jgi:hypothetical protein